MDFKTIYLKGTWVDLPKDGHSNSYSRVFDVKLHNGERGKPFKSLEWADWGRFHQDFHKEFNYNFYDCRNLTHDLLSIDKYGDRILVDRTSEYGLKNIVHMHNGLSGAIIPLLFERKLEEWEKKAAESAVIATKSLGTCKECAGDIIGNLFKCCQCSPDYSMCGRCADLGKHSQHLVIRLTNPEMSLDSVVNQLIPSNEKKVDSISLALLEKLEALVAATTQQSEELRRLTDTHYQLTITGKDLCANRKKMDQLRDQNLILNSPDFEINGAVGLKSSLSSSSASVWTLDDDEGESINSSSAQEGIPTKKAVPRHADSVIDAALRKMLDMGFKDDGGWLTRLLEVKGGDIDQVLNVLKFNK